MLLRRTIVVPSLPVVLSDSSLSSAAVCAAPAGNQSSKYCVVCNEDLAAVGIYGSKSDLEARFRAPYGWGRLPVWLGGPSARAITALPRRTSTCSLDSRAAPQCRSGVE